MIAPSPFSSAVARAAALPASLRGLSLSYHRPSADDAQWMPSGDPISNAPVTGGGPPSQPWIHYVDRVGGDRSDPAYYPQTRNPEGFCNRPRLIPGQAQPDNYPPDVNATPPVGYLAAGAPTYGAGAPEAPAATPMPTWLSLLGGAVVTASAAASAFHGYKRNEDRSDSPALWAAVWFLGGTFLPVFTPVLALAEGFAKPARK